MKRLQLWLLSALLVLAPQAVRAQVRLSTLPRITSTSGLADSSLFLCNDSTNTRTSACTFFSIRKRLQTTKWDSLSLKRIHPDSIFGAPVWMSKQTLSTSGLADSSTGAARAQTLTTARTIWGQSFNGTANVSGAISGVTTLGTSGLITAGANILPASDNSGSLGISSQRWADIRSVLGTFSGAVGVGGTLGVTGLTTASGGVRVTGGGFFTGSMYKDATFGLSLGGVAGVTTDITLFNSVGSVVFQNPTGTINAIFAGTLGTASPLTVTGATQGMVNINTSNGAISNSQSILFQSGGVNKWRLGNNVTGTNTNLFELFNESVTAWSVDRTTNAFTTNGIITGLRHIGGIDPASAVAKGAFSDGTALDAGTGSATVSGVLSTATLASNVGTQSVGTFEGKQTAASTGTADVLTGTGWAAHTSGTLAGSIGVHGSGRFDGSGGTTTFADMVRGGNFLVGAGHTVTTLRSLYANTGSNAGTIGTQIGLEVANIALGSTNFSIKTGTGAVSLGDSLNVTGLARFSGGVAGTATNDNAAAGIVGEYMSHATASGASVGMSSATTTTVDSLSLTAGDWDVTGVLDFVFGTTTSFSDITGGFSTTRSVLGAQDSGFGFSQAPSVPSAAFTQAWNLPLVRFSVASTTKVYLVVQGTFTVSTLGAYGTIRARRVR